MVLSSFFQSPGWLFRRENMGVIKTKEQKAARSRLLSDEGWTAIREELIEALDEAPWLHQAMHHMGLCCFNEDLEGIRKMQDRELRILAGFGFRGIMEMQASLFADERVPKTFKGYFTEKNWE
jgi:hypothetical protein